MSRKQTITTTIVGFMSGILLTIGGYTLLDYYQKNSTIPQSQNTSTEKRRGNNTLIVLSPHFDDAVLTVGDLIAEYAGKPYIVTFCTTPEILPPSTTIQPYLTHWDELSGFQKSSDSRDARLQENESAAKIVGAEIINFGYVDNQYETRTPENNVLIVQSMVKDVKRIIESLYRLKNSEITIIGPSYFGEEHTHPDHALVSQTLVQLAKDTRDDQSICYLFAEDNLYTSKRFGTGEITLDTLLTEQYEGIRLTKRELSISEASFEKKLLAIGMYTSQVRAFHNLGDDILQITTDYELNRVPQDPLPQKPFIVLYEIQVK